MGQSNQQPLHGLFTTQAASYARFRPDYPPELYNKLFELANLRCHDLAVDLATGSGQGDNLSERPRAERKLTAPAC